ncbi:MAG TPA: phosphatidate cytidylyltransferase, partial [Chthoniobacteraceae bacterium]
MIWGLHPVTFWILVSLAAALALTPVIFLALEKARPLAPALRSDLWLRYKSWLVLTPLMVLPLVAGRLLAILAVGVLAALCYREFSRATGLFRERLVSAVVALGLFLITFAIADHWYGFFLALHSLVVSAIVIFALFMDQPK